MTMTEIMFASNLCAFILGFAVCLWYTRRYVDREIGRIEEKMLREAMEHYAARSDAAKRGHVTLRHNRDRIHREMAAEWLDGVEGVTVEIQEGSAVE